VSHSHTGTSSWDSDQDPRLRKNENVGGGADAHHTHTIYLNANTPETVSTYSGSAGSADTVEPAYKKLMAIQNTSGFRKVPPTGTIAMWLGSLSSIPPGWFLCDGTKGTPDMRDKWLKIANDASEIGSTGGSNTHSHSASNSHTHTATSNHTHTGYTSTVYTSPSGTDAASDGACKTPHSHSVSTCSYATSSWDSTTVSSNSADGQPPFRTVAYIMFKYMMGGMGFFNELL
jgi:hypothetical protein